MKKTVNKPVKVRTTEQKPKRVEQVIELIKKIEKADNLASIENQKVTGERLQILPGNRTGVVTSLSLR
jgi:hypothetical protein